MLAAPGKGVTMQTAYEFKTKPYAHQREALNRMRGKSEYALLMEMGTGKTKVAIDEMGILHTVGEIDAAVIIAPKGVYRNWVHREIPAHLPDHILERAYIYQWDNYANQRSKWRAGQIMKHSAGLRILVMNVEALSVSEKARTLLKQFLTKYRCAVYVDESTTIKNHSSSRSKAISKLGPLAKYRRIMTGSPVTRSPLDFWAQFNFLRPGLIGSRNYVAFRARYAVIETKFFGSRKVDVVSGYRNLGELKDAVAEHSFRVLKEDCLDLPPKIYQTHEVFLTEEQQRAYNAMRDEAFAELAGGGFASATAVITQIIKLHQITCGHVTDLDGKTVPLENRRIHDLMDIVEEMEGKVVIWSNYRYSIGQIVASLGHEYGNESVVQYHGMMKQEDCEKSIDRFQNDPKCRFFVATQSKGGYGITLTAGSNVIYFSNNYDLEKRLQSEDRTHRSGQKKSVTYVDMICRGTVEEKIVAALLAKKNIADLVTGDKVRYWFGKVTQQDLEE